MEILEIDWYAMINSQKVFVDAISTKKNEEVDKFYENFDYVGQHTVIAENFKNTIHKNAHCYVYKKEKPIVKDIILYGNYSNL